MIFKWIIKQGILIKDNDDNFYELLASQIVYQFIGRIIFYETIKSKLPNIITKIDVNVNNSTELHNEILEKFKNVKNIDYNAIFTDDIPDKVSIPDECFEIFKNFINDLEKYNFSSIKQEVLGEIFQQLIPHDERHKLGQYFTNEDLVDFINSFCILNKDSIIFDPTCGTGTFLIRAYDKFQKQYNVIDHRDLLDRLWGCEIAPFPSELATINLYRQNISEYSNFPRIIKEDFFKISKGDIFDFPPNKQINIDKIPMEIPQFDAIVGNFPYIRQEEIEKVEKNYRQKVILPALIKGWHDDLQNLDEYLFKKTKNNIDIKINKKSDIYSFMYIHAGAFLKDNGRMGFVTSSTYLNNEYGKDLKDFFLRNFKIIAIVESKCEPWFPDVSVTTVFTILERCKDKNLRDNHNVKFVRLQKRLSDLLPYDKKIEFNSRYNKLDKLIYTIEECNLSTLIDNICFFENDDLKIKSIKQKYLTGSEKWGIYLKDSTTFLLLQNNKKFKKLLTLGNIQRGFTTGLNNFFYLNEQKLKNLILKMNL